ncbi:hypothetical protein NQ176_g2792 [Zarea fungicola]|uniref:Uncharacterized protein n=1 Tax=Zarea fungicola TaxID=93591 RepID=A0ACC1NMY9_9HYPO|nr:hypothetical protein NQ176_g2792 [Lecanicillium fungicola]
MRWYNVVAAFAAIGGIQAAAIERDTDAVGLKDRARVSNVGTTIAIVGGIAATNALGQAFFGHGDLIAEAWAAAIVDQLHPVGLAATSALWVDEIGQSGLICWTVDAVFTFAGPNAYANAANFANAAKNLLGKRGLDFSNSYTVYRSDIDLPANHTVFGIPFDSDANVEARNVGSCSNPGFDFTHNQNNAELCLPRSVSFPPKNSRKCL